MHEFDSMSDDQTLAERVQGMLTFVCFSINTPKALSLNVMDILFLSEEITKLEDLQDKNLTQKEMLRDLTAKIEVCDFTCEI